MPEERPPLPVFEGPGARRSKRSFLGVVELCALAAVLLGLLVGAPKIMSWWMGPDSARLAVGSDVLLGPNAKNAPALSAASLPPSSPAAAVAPTLGGQDSTSMVVWGRRRRRKHAADGAAGSALSGAPGAAGAAGASGAAAGADEDDEDDGPDDGKDSPGGVADDGWQRHMGQPQTPAGAQAAALPSGPAASANPDVAKQLDQARALANSYLQAGNAGYRQAMSGQPSAKLQAPQGLGRVNYNSLPSAHQFGGGANGVLSGAGSAAAGSQAASRELVTQPTRTLGATSAVMQGAGDTRAAASAAATNSGGGAVGGGGGGGSAAAAAPATAASTGGGTTDSGATGGSGSHPPIVTSPTTVTSGGTTGGSTGGTTSGSTGGTTSGSTGGTTTGSTGGTTTGSTGGTTTGSTGGTTTTSTGGNKLAGAGGGGCFVAGTPVLTPSGPRAIETLGPGDIAYSYDPLSGALVPETILAGPMPHPGSNIYRVAFEDGASFEATSGHPVYGADGRYRPAGSLSAGDEVLAAGAASGAAQMGLGAPAALPARTLFAAAPAALPAAPARLLRVASVTRLPVPQATVYDLTMDGPFHNFVAAGVVVHNLQALQAKTASY